MSAVDRIAAVMMGGADPCEGSLSDAEAILAALPGLLREDSDDGADLRARLGLPIGPTAAGACRVVSERTASEPTLARVVETCCAHPKCPGGSLCCCEGGR